MDKNLTITDRSLILLKDFKPEQKGAAYFIREYIASLFEIGVCFIEIDYNIYSLFKNNFPFPLNRFIFRINSHAPESASIVNHCQKNGNPFAYVVLDSKTSYMQLLIKTPKIREFYSKNFLTLKHPESFIQGFLNKFDFIRIIDDFDYETLNYNVDLCNSLYPETTSRLDICPLNNTMKGALAASKYKGERLTLAFGNCYDYSELNECRNYTPIEEYIIQKISNERGLLSEEMVNSISKAAFYSACFGGFPSLLLEYVGRRSVDERGSFVVDDVLITEEKRPKVNIKNLPKFPTLDEAALYMGYKDDMHEAMKKFVSDSCLFRLIDKNNAGGLIN